jgi:hypothetical protein
VVIEDGDHVVDLVFVYGLSDLYFGFVVLVDFLQLLPHLLLE